MNKITFITSFLTFYLKGEISQEKNFVKFKIPNTILGLIPLGSHKKNIAINQISSVDTDFRLLFKNLVIGIIFAIIGLASLSSSGAGIIFLALGVLIALASFQTELRLNLTSGESLSVYFIISEKSKAQEAADSINNLISEGMDDTNNRAQTDRIVDVINDKK